MNTSEEAAAIERLAVDCRYGLAPTSDFVVLVVRIRGDERARAETDIAAKIRAMADALEDEQDSYGAGSLRDAALHIAESRYPRSA